MSNVFYRLKVSLALFLMVFGLSVSTMPISVLAADTGSCELQDAAFLGLPTWYKYLDGEEDVSRPRDGGFVCSPVISDVDAILPIGLAILDGLLRFSGVVTIIMIFWASFKFLTSQGNGETAAEARRTAINALIGLVIVVIATSLVSFVGNRLSSPSVTSQTADKQVASHGSYPTITGVIRA